MGKIGTVSSAVGFIYLGVWLIVKNIDSGFADQLFNWWPMIIIFIGLEILYFLKKSTQGEKLRFNGLIIVVVIIFIAINASQNVYSRFDNLFKHGTSISMFDSYKYRYKSIDIVKTIETSNKGIVFLAKSGKFNIKKSQDNTVRIEAEIYVDKSSSLNEWDVKELPGINDVRIDLRDAAIREVSGDIYVPEGCSVQFETGNLDIISDDVGIEKLVVDSRNGNIMIGNNIKNIQAKMHNGKVKFIGNSENVNIDIDNGRIDIGGNINTMELKLQSGTIDIDNKNEKTATIEMVNGVLNYNTTNHDASINIMAKNGVGMVNGRKIGIGAASDVFGTGASKINLKVGNGTIRFSNQE